MLEVFFGVDHGGAGVACVFLGRLQHKATAAAAGGGWWCLLLLLLERLQGRGEGVRLEQQSSCSLRAHPRAHRLLLRHQHRVRGRLLLPYFRQSIPHPTRRKRAPMSIQLPLQLPLRRPSLPPSPARLRRRWKYLGVFCPCSSMISGGVPSISTTRES